MEIKNGCTVHRIWGDLSEAELIAVFNYATDAEVFCRASIEKQPEPVTLAYVNHYDGSMKFVRKPKKDAAT